MQPLDAELVLGDAVGVFHAVVVVREDALVRTRRSARLPQDDLVGRLWDGGFLVVAGLALGMLQITNPDRAALRIVVAPCHAARLADAAPELYGQFNDVGHRQFA